jgi:hypothetical protein
MEIKSTGSMRSGRRSKIIVADEWNAAHQTASRVRPEERVEYLLKLQTILNDVPTSSSQRSSKGGETSAVSVDPKLLRDDFNLVPELTLPYARGLRTREDDTGTSEGTGGLSIRLAAYKPDGAKAERSRQCVELLGHHTLWDLQQMLCCVHNNEVSVNPGTDQHGSGCSGGSGAVFFVEGTVYCQLCSPSEPGAVCACRRLSAEEALSSAGQFTIGDTSKSSSSSSTSREDVSVGRRRVVPLLGSRSTSGPASTSAPAQSPPPVPAVALSLLAWLQSRLAADTGSQKRRRHANRNAAESQTATHTAPAPNPLDDADAELVLMQAPESIVTPAAVGSRTKGKGKGKRATAAAGVACLGHSTVAVGAHNVAAPSATSNKPAGNSDGTSTEETAQVQVPQFSLDLKELSHQIQRGERTLGVACIHSAQLQCMDLRPGVPYLYTHASGCEHVLCVTDIRPAAEHPSGGTAALVQGSNGFPREVHRAPPTQRRCTVCDLLAAQFVVFGDKLAPCSPAFFCT